MSRTEIQVSLGQLHPNSPYFRRGFRDWPEKLRSSTSAERISLACADPAFGFNIPSSYAAAGQQLPAYAWPQEVVRAFEFFRGTNVNDPDIRAALRFNDVGQETYRAVLRAGLLCDVTLEELAARLVLRLGVVRAFEVLCWNCRDRRCDLVYLARLCRICSFGYAGTPAGSSQSWEARLLRLAFETRDLDQVLDFASSGAIGCAPPSIRTADLEQRVLSQVLLGLRARRLSKQDNPLLEPVLASLSRRDREPQTSASADSGPSVAESISWTFSPLTPDEPSPSGRNR